MVLVILLPVLRIGQGKIQGLGHLFTNSLLNSLIRGVMKPDLPCHQGFYLSYAKRLFSLCKMQSIMNNYFYFME